MARPKMIVRLYELPDEPVATYKVVRHYQNAGIRRRTIATGLTLEQAQAHCQNPETSSRTATGKVARARTRRVGEWLDGYDVERSR